MDLGSSVLSVKAALGGSPPGRVGFLRVADAPLVEGAIAAGVMASTGDDMDGVLRAAEEARHVPSSEDVTLVRLPDDVALHARPAGMFVRAQPEPPPTSGSRRMGGA